MTVTADARFDVAEALLLERHADRVQHPGGTLLAHLGRVRDRLAAWDASPELQLAGLCHAMYGTDGFPVTLLPPDQRPLLEAAIGAETECIVYLYGSCTRSSAYPQLAQSAAEIVDRFSGRRRVVEGAELRAFVEISAANELDVVQHSQVIAGQHGDGLRRPFMRAQPHLSPSARAAWDAR